MTSADALAFAVGIAGVVAVVAASVIRRTWRLGLAMALDLWLAAGLLRLVGDPTWERITAAAALVAVRRLIGLGLRTRAPRSRPGRRTSPARP